MAYGLPLWSLGGVPAGGDAANGYLVTTAPHDAHLQVVALSYEGGDNGEVYDFYLHPPGTAFPTANVNNAVIWFDACPADTSIGQISVCSNKTRTGGPSAALMVPAGYCLGVTPRASSTAALTVRCVVVPESVR